jgi:hypothetical protein
MANDTPEYGAGDTIISIPKPARLEALIQSAIEPASDRTLAETRFKIRLANSEGRRSNASYLIQRRYAWRGYDVGSSTSPATVPNVVTLAAFDQDALVATISVGIDSPAGLVVEQLYPEEVAAFRARTGTVLCEFTRLAVDNMVRSRAVLAAVFHIAYLYARQLCKATDLLIEVNPRHVKFYVSMLGFEIAAAERMDPRVKAPAVLLRLNLAYAESEIARWGGRRECANDTRLLYPLFFSPVEEKGIEGRLRAMEQAESVQFTPVASGNPS